MMLAGSYRHYAASRYPNRPQTILKFVGCLLAVAVRLKLFAGLETDCLT